uniref:Uncharacterized protein n=2 Tax=Arion vulgaris TaxID=1028688 RepID=A0A0B6ZU81_9EUPU
MGPFVPTGIFEGTFILVWLCVPASTFVRVGTFVPEGTLVLVGTFVPVGLFVPLDTLATVDTFVPMFGTQQTPRRPTAQSVPIDRRFSPALQDCLHRPPRKQQGKVDVHLTYGVRR